MDLPSYEIELCMIVLRKSVSKGSTRRESVKKDCQSYIILRRTGVQSLFRPFYLVPKLFLFNLVSLIVMKTSELLYMTRLLQV